MTTLPTPRTSGIYAIVNEQTGAIYIGSSRDIRSRWFQHRRELRSGSHHSIVLQRAWEKYGEATFSLKVLEAVETDLLIEREQFYLDTQKPRYNRSTTARTPSLDPEIRKKISSSRLGKSYHTPEGKARIAAAAKARHPWNKGVKLNPEHVAKRAASNSGKKRTEEQRRRISEANKGQVCWRRGATTTEETRQKIAESVRLSWIERRQKTS